MPMVPVTPVPGSIILYKAPMKRKTPYNKDTRRPAARGSANPRHSAAKPRRGPSNDPARDKTASTQTSAPSGTHQRRSHKSRASSDKFWLYGMHTVRAALTNPNREKFRLLATENAAQRINIAPASYYPLEVEQVEPGKLNHLLGTDAVHQGVALQVSPLPTTPLEDMDQSPLVLVLDQITDPHNVGAILRTSVAMNAGAVITTNRHSANETAVLAKSASGGLDMIEHIQVGNLSKAITSLSNQGYFCIGLDSEGPAPLEQTFALAPNEGRHIALVLGAEGQGLRKKTRETCDALARLDMPGSIKSLNVSNAAAIALYAARMYLDD